MYLICYLLSRFVYFGDITVHEGLKLLVFSSREDIILVESPTNKTAANPPLHNLITLPISLGHNKRPLSSDLEIVNPVSKGVTLVFATIR